MPAPRLKPRPTDVNALRDRDSHEREEMLQALAVCAQRQRPLDGHNSPTAVRSIANRLHVTDEAVYHQIDGQTLSNPLVELCAWIDGALAAGKPEAHAFEPIAWLIRRYQPQAREETTRVELTGSCASALSGATSVVQAALESICENSPGGAAATADELRVYRQGRLALDRRLAELDQQMEARHRCREQVQ